MKKLFGFILILLAMCLQTTASQGAPYWAKTYGGINGEQAREIETTSDGGYIVIGDNSSEGAGSSDVWILKLDYEGNVTWEKTYGGSGTEGGASIRQTTDGGYIVAGRTTSVGAGLYDFWVLKLDENGNIVWQKTYGESSDDIPSSIKQTNDGGYIVAGSTKSFGGGSNDYWILKLDPDGIVEWENNYLGGTGSEVIYSIHQTSDGGYIVGGDTASFGAGNFDYWVLKLNSDGTTAWQKTYGFSGYDRAYSIQPTSDGGYIVVGETRSVALGLNDFWVLKLNSDGTTAWQKTYGGNAGDSANSVQETLGGGYIVVGSTNSFGAGGDDLLVLKLASDGTIHWQKTYGDVSTDKTSLGETVKQTSDGDYIIAARTDSLGAGGDDLLLLKIDRNGDIPDCDFIGTSNVIVTDTSIIAQDTTAAVESTSANVEDTSIIPLDTSADISTICYEAGFCKGLADFDEDVDGADVGVFISQFGRSPYYLPCPPDGPAPVAKTGQTTCYDETGAVIDCYGTGQNGEYLQGVGLSRPRFKDNENGTVTDNLTGLIWLKDANCFGPSWRIWDQALSDCNGLASGACGLTDGSGAGDWRLPSRFELESLLNLEYYGPAVPDTAGTGQWSEGDPFTKVRSNPYWSSTSFSDSAYITGDAWRVDMHFGYVSSINKSLGAWVWPVRGGH